MTRTPSVRHRLQAAAIAVATLHAKPEKEVSVFVRGRGVLYAPEPKYPVTEQAHRRGGTGLFELHVRPDGNGLGSRGPTLHPRERPGSRRGTDIDPVAIPAESLRESEGPITFDP